jgi:hypothetical protein
VPLLLLVSRVGAAQWTVAVYMAADNGLADQSYADLAEMMQVGSSTELNLVVQVDRPARDTNPGCRRYLIRKGRLELLEQVGEVDMADTLTLVRFGRFVRDRYPARNYCLVLWDHGSGWSEGYGPRRAIFIDESHGHMMGVAGGELAAGVAGFRRELGSKVEAVVFDACLMGMTEVAAELGAHANYLLASEGAVVWDGLDYCSLTTHVAGGGTLPERLSRVCADYVAAYPDDYVCLSALDLSKLNSALPVLARCLGGLATHDSSFRAHLRQVRSEVQTFAPVLTRPPCRTDDQVDLIHFFELLPGADSLVRTLKRVVVASAASESLPHAQGLAVWFPDGYLGFKNSARSYQKLEFADTVPWPQFLNSFFGRDDVKPSQPVLAEPRPGRRGDVRLYWSRSEDLAPVSYDLFELTGPSEVLVENGESLGRWSNSGWTLSSGQARSGSYSFYSGAGANLDNRITTAEPLELSSGGLLSLYAWYATEETQDSLGGMVRDVCYVEWSADCADWQVLDSFYGSQRAWHELRIVLPVTSSLYLRFCYRTNATNHGTGVYLDDIKVYRFDTFRQVTATAETTAYVFNRPRDTTGYCYLVTARDSFGNVSMASQFSEVVPVRKWAEPYTRPAPFDGPCKLVLDFPAGEVVDVSIYTLSGTLVRRFRGITEKTLDWDGCNQSGKPLADGAYIVAVRGKGFRTIGKIARAGR